MWGFGKVGVAKREFFGVDGRLRLHFHLNGCAQIEVYNDMAWSRNNKQFEVTLEILDGQDCFLAFGRSLVNIWTRMNSS